MNKLMCQTIFALIAGFGDIQGEILNVPDQFDTIRRAMTASEDGDTVLLQPGRYQETISFNGKEITVASLFLMTGNYEYITNTIIDGNADGRVIAFSNDENENSIVTGLTITNGLSSFGGGIYIREASPVINYVIIHSNDVQQRGGGIYCTGEGSPQFDHITVSNNTAQASNGGIHAFNDAEPIITNSIFWGNEPDEYPQNLLTVTYSNMRNGHAGEGNINLNPRFADPENQDYQITWDNYPNFDNSRSRSIDAGDPDFDDDPDDTRTDMGALYFFQSPDEPVIDLSHDEIDFRTVPIDGSLDIVLEIRNIGIQELEIDDIVIEPERFTLDNEGDFTLEPGEIEEVIVTFSPVSEDEIEGEIRISSNDPDDEIVTVGLRGSGMIGYYVDIQEGWNMISSPIEPFDLDIEAILQNLVESGTLIFFKDYQGRFYWPGQNFNNVPDWYYQHGYYLKASRDDSLAVLGDIIPVDTQIQLLQGYTIAAYYPEEAVDVEVALADIIDQLIIAKDGLGRFYLPEYGWGNMGLLRRGQGYKLKVSEEVNLVWNIDERHAASQPHHPSIFPPEYFKPIERSFANMSLLVNSSYIYGSSVELGVFDEAGSCIGAFRLSDQNPHGGAIWSGEMLNEPVVEGNDLRFLLWDGSELIQPGVEIEVGVTTFVSDEILVINLVESINLPSRIQIIGVYPNPFNSSVEISYSLPEAGQASLGIYDLNGRQVVVLSHGDMPAGVHSAVWQAADNPSGVYFVRLRQGRAVSFERILLIR